MPKKKQEETMEGAPLWMTTYGDLMTLLLCFFVLLLSFSSIQQKEFDKAIGSLQGYLGVLVGHKMALVDADYSTPEMVSQLNPTNKKEEAEQDEVKPESYLITLAQDIQKESKKKGIGGPIEVVQVLNTLRIRMPVSVVFNQGEKTFNKDSVEFLTSVVKLIKDSPYYISVEGHTDNVPIYSESYNSNWELGIMRSIAVLNYLVKLGISPDRLSAVSYGEFRPVATNDTEEGRSRNRRVEIVINSEKKIFEEPEAAKGTK
ncbi:flagellar motor protein MotB [bacterium]|nr:flagellar motor protein MotB [bacterium]